MVKVVTSVGNLIKILKKIFETNILWKKFCDNYFCGTNIFWDQMFLGRNFLGVMVLGTKFLTAIFGTKSILEQHFFQTKYFKTKLRQTVSAWVSPNSTPACPCNLMIRGGVIMKKGENFCATFKKGMTPPPPLSDISDIFEFQTCLKNTDPPLGSNSDIFKFESILTI